MAKMDEFNDDFQEDLKDFFNAIAEAQAKNEKNQMEEAFKDLTTILHVFYQECKEVGFDSHEALSLTCEATKILLTEGMRMALED